MSYYNPRNDLLYGEAEVALDVIGIVDLFRNAAYEISVSERNPFQVRGREVRLNKAKSSYTFFKDHWADARVVKSLTDSAESGRDFSDAHLAVLMYGMRQNFFALIREGDRYVGWYLNPDEVYCGVLPAVFDDFQEAYARGGGKDGQGALALQSRNNDFLGRVAYDFGQHVQRNFVKDGAPFKECKVTPPPQ